MSRFIAVLLSILVFSPSFGAQVQARGVTSNSGTTINCLLVSGSTAGNDLVVLVGYMSTGNHLVGVADNQSQTWSAAYTPTGVRAVYYFPNTVAGVTTITVTFDASEAAECFAIERDDLDLSSPVDKTAQHQDSSTASFSSGATSTTAQADEWLVSLTAQYAGSGITATPDSPWTAIAGTGITAGTIAHGGAGGTAFAMDRIVSSTGAYTGTGTLSSSVSNSWSAIVTFKLAAAGSSGLLLRRRR
jgi:hypothetical protein